MVPKLLPTCAIEAGSGLSPGRTGSGWIFFKCWSVTKWHNAIFVGRKPASMSSAGRYAFHAPTGWKRANN